MVRNILQHILCGGSMDVTMLVGVIRRFLVSMLRTLETWQQEDDL